VALGETVGAAKPGGTVNSVAEALAEATSPTSASGGAPLKQLGDARVFIAEAYKYAKPIVVTGEGEDLIAASLPEGAEWQTLIFEKAAQAILTALARHRHFGLPDLDHLAA
jgi:hypothetical protein